MYVVLGWGEGGWDVNVHLDVLTCHLLRYLSVLVFAQLRHVCCLGVGWVGWLGGKLTFMIQIDVLTCHLLRYLSLLVFAQLRHVYMLSWGGWGGWDVNVHVDVLTCQRC